MDTLAPVDTKAKMRTVGYVLALVGLFTAAASLVPSIVPEGGFAWPLFVGSFVYLNGAFLVFVGAQTKDRKAHMGKLRFIRLGFVAVMMLVLWQIVTTNRS